MRRGLPAAFHLSEEDEVARVSLPNEVWNKGVAAANPIFQTRLRSVVRVRQEAQS
jgi:hypothetical protein